MFCCLAETLVCLKTGEGRQIPSRMRDIMTDLDSLNRVSIEKKQRFLESGLSRLGWSEAVPVIETAPLQNGIRTRSKLKIFPEVTGIRVCGTDPVRGEVPLQDMLWVFPEWFQIVPSQIQDIIASDYKEFPVDGWEVNLSHGNQQAHILLSVKRGQRTDYQPFAEKLLDLLEPVKGVAVPSLRISWGDDWINHNILGLDLTAHHTAFFQSHPALTPRLLQTVKQALGDEEQAEILDLYCGVGLFSLFLGSPSTRVLGVDSHALAIKSARRNARQLKRSLSQYVNSRLEDCIRDITISPSCLVVLDPPRSGCPAGIIETVAEQSPDKICLISCWPATHFRDLEIWTAADYAIRSMAALDMFPLTDFLETVTVLEKQA